MEEQEKQEIFDTIRLKGNRAAARITAMRNGLLLSVDIGYDAENDMEVFDFSQVPDNKWEKAKKVSEAIKILLSIKI